MMTQTESFRDPLKHLRITNFTAFSDLKLDFSPGINVLIGANATGKTHVMKLLYSACRVTITDEQLAEMLTKNFLPYRKKLGRLVRRRQGVDTAEFEIHRETAKMKMQFSTRVKTGTETTTGMKLWYSNPIDSVFIPVKEMLANAPGFGSLYKETDIHFEGVYADIVSRALLPLKRGFPDQRRQTLLDIIRKPMKGVVYTKQEEFFLRSSEGSFEFTLLSEGFRKLGLLWILIQNGTLSDRSILFWDEPEANLNPNMLKFIVEIILELQTLGVQVFITTHNYVLLKEFSLQAKSSHNILYHAFYRGSRQEGVLCKSTDDFYLIEPNAIADTFDDLYDRSIREGMKEIDRDN